MKKIILCSGLLATLVFTGCSSDDSGSENNNNDFYTIVNKGSGSVSVLTDFTDTEPLEVAQAVPSVSGQQYPANTPAVFFMNDKLLLSSVNEDTFIVKENGKKVGGTLSVNEAANGYGIITFMPYKTFANNANINITLTTGLQDDGGQGLSQDMNYEYTTYSVPSTSLGDSTGFESGMNGIVFIGDGNIVSNPLGCLSPFAGSSFAAITSGDALVSGSNAIGGTSSAMILGPFDSNSASSLSFNYNFLSAEFLEYVGSEFDDSFMAVVVGQNGAHVEFVTSVNTIGNNVTQCEGFPGMPDDGDDYAGFTGWTSKTINFGSLSGPVYVIFMTTDVTDDIYSTVVGIDGVSLN